MKKIVIRFNAPVILTFALLSLLALLLGGCAAALVAWLIGLPVLRLKSDYLAIATLGFAEIIRAVFQWDPLGPVTNGANALKNFPTLSSFNIQDGSGKVLLRLSTFVPFLLAAVCISVGAIATYIFATYFIKIAGINAVVWGLMVGAVLYFGIGFVTGRKGLDPDILDKCF